MLATTGGAKRLGLLGSSGTTSRSLSALGIGARGAPAASAEGMRERGAPAASLGEGVGRSGSVRGDCGFDVFSLPFETEMEGTLSAASRVRAGTWDLDFERMPPALPGRESGGELEKSKTRSSPDAEVSFCLLLRVGNHVFFSSLTRWASSRGVRPDGGVQSPPEAGVDAPDNVGRDS